MQFFNVFIWYSTVPNILSFYSIAVWGILFGHINDWNKYSALTFPKQTKCSYFSYGPSGGTQLNDALCVMPLNLFNEKIFAILYIWYIVSITASVINLIYLCCLWMNKKWRIEIIRHRTMMTASRKEIRRATNNGCVGDYFILNQMAKNVNPLVFVELINELALNRQPTNGDDCILNRSY